MVQGKCKSNAIKLACIVEVQPFLSKDTRSKIVEVKVDGHPSSCQKDPKEEAHLPEQSTTEEKSSCVRIPCGVANDQRIACFPKEPKLSGVEATDREVGGPMLNVTGLNRFYYLRDFTDMRCKHSRVLSIIREQLHREPSDGDVFIVMSRDRRIVRLFTYDNRSYALFEKKFVAGHQFMKVDHDGDERVYRIDWKDVVLLLENPIVNTLKIK